MKFKQTIITCLLLTTAPAFAKPQALKLGTIAFKATQTIQLNCKGYGQIQLTRYDAPNAFDFLRMVDKDKQVRFLPLVGGNTALIYQAVNNGIEITTDGGDLSKPLTIKTPSDDLSKNQKYNCSTK